MIQIGTEINSILRNKYIKNGIIILLLLFVISFDSSFNKYVSNRLNDNIAIRLIVVLMILLLIGSAHYEIGVMVILGFILSMYNSNLRSILKTKINSNVEKLDKQIDNFLNKENNEENDENNNENNENNENINNSYNENNENINNSYNENISNNPPCLSQDEIIHSNNPVGKLTNETDFGNISSSNGYFELNTETQKLVE